MYEFWYDYVKPKYDDKAKLCYMGTESFIAHLKTNIYKDIAQDVKIKFDTSNYKLKGLLPKGRKLLVYDEGLMVKDKLGGKNLLDQKQKLIVI